MSRLAASRGFEVRAGQLAGIALWLLSGRGDRQQPRKPQQRGPIVDQTDLERHKRGISNIYEVRNSVNHNVLQ
jgi:hypothetical protein